MTVYRKAPLWKRIPGGMVALVPVAYLFNMCTVQQGELHIVDLWMLMLMPVCAYILVHYAITGYPPKFMMGERKWW